MITISLFSASVTLLLFRNKFICTPFLDSKYKWYHDICLSTLLTLFSTTISKSMLLQMALSYSFYGWATLGAGGEGDDRGWDGWMSSPTQWTWAWVNSRRWWWTGRPGVMKFMGLQRVRHDWGTELNWLTEHSLLQCITFFNPFFCWWTFRLLLCPGYCK